MDSVVPTSWYTTLSAPLPHAVFTNPNARRLIQPELDSGVLTPSDYTTLAEYYSSRKLKQGIWGSFLLPGLVAVLCRSHNISLRAPASIIAIVGSSSMPIVYLASKDRSSQRDLYNRLENRDGVIRAVENARLRFLAVSAKQNASAESSTGFDAQEPTDPQQLTTGPAPVQPVAQPSKWEQLRAANAQQGRQSTWDSLRQKHEQTKTRQDSPPEGNESAWGGDNKW